MRRVRRALIVLVVAAIWIFTCISSAAGTLNYSRSGVGTDMSGYMLYGTGNYARIYIYPNAVSLVGKKVNSIYLVRADHRTWVESGFMTIPISGGEYSFGFAFRYSLWTGPEEFYGGPTVSAGTYPDTDLVVAGNNVDVYFNQQKYKTFTNMSLTTGRGIWGEERNSLQDNGNGSFRYCQYKTASGWVYWPYGVADYVGAQNNDPQIHFVRTDIPSNHWAHFDY